MLNRKFINSYSKLPPNFFSHTNPTKVSQPRIIKVNQALASELDINIAEFSSSELAEIFSGNRVPQHSTPIAQAYAGHQFGHFNPSLGDGRAILLGDITDTHNKLRELQLKGAGPTPYSRSGDGRAAIGPVVREYILSEAMHRLGINTTRALAAVTTGDAVYRQDAQAGAIITRVASSFIRIGTFEYFRATGSQDSLKQLADYVIQRHYPLAAQAENPYLQLLEEVIRAQASLVARWMQVGFIHGVLNTDNVSICGDTLDYGPCAFMDKFEPMTVFSSIDRDGRYAYGNQPNITRWNLTRFAECLLPLIDKDLKSSVKKAESSLDTYSTLYEGYWQKGMMAKIGITNPNTNDRLLLEQLLNEMTAHNLDFTSCFRSLAVSLNDDSNTEGHPLADWIHQWQLRLGAQDSSLATVAANMNAVNPIYIPRNHLVEEAISAAQTDSDYTPMEDLMAVLAQPYTSVPGKERYSEAPSIENSSYQTFCGT